MTKILDLGWEEMRIPSGSGFFSPPTTTGSGSLGVIRTGSTILSAETASLVGAMLSPGGAISGDNPTLIGGNPARAGKSMACVQLNDFDIAGNANAQTPMIQFYFGNTTSTQPNLTKWSARIVMRCPLPFSATAAHLFSGLKHVGASSPPTMSLWSLSGQWSALTVNRKIIVINGTGGGGTLQYTGDASQSWGMNGWGRLEIQADSTFAGPNIVFRWYPNDGSTAHLGPLWGTVNGNADACGFALGDFYNLPLAFEDTTYYFGDIEAWDNRHADGLMSDTWSTAAGGAFTSTPSPNGRRTSLWSFPSATYHRHLDTPTLPPHTYHQNIPYGNNQRVMDMWIPGGTPPSAGGWPCILYVHGGFWVAGRRTEIPQAWLAAMLGAGYAVCSVEYILGSMCGHPFNATSTYPAYGFAGAPTQDENHGGGARFPSDICDVKLAAVRLKAKYAHGVVGTAKTNGTGWGINPNLVGIAGFSAGSNTALMACLTRGLADVDGAGKDVRMATADGGLYNTDETGAHNLSADPTFIFYLGYAIPFDLELAINNDFGANISASWRFGSALSSSMGAGFMAGTIVQNTLKARYATWLGGTVPTLAQQQVLGCTNALTRNAGIVSTMHMRGVWGTADYLINHAQHKVAADAFMPGKVAHWESDTVPSIHDWTNHIGKIGFPDDIAFLNAAVTAAGVTPPDPPAPGFAGGLNIPRLTTIATIATPIGGTRDTGVTPVGTLTWDGGNWNDGNWT